MSPPANTLSSRFWTQLIGQLREAETDQRVAPVVVVGPDAVLVDGERGPEPIDSWLARRVAAQLELDVHDGAIRLNDVACQWSSTAGSQHMDELYGAVKAALDERPLEIPPALRKLAAIRPLQLFVTTTPDDLMARALDAARPVRALRLAYEPKTVEDLPKPLAGLHGVPVAYQLLGRASTAPVFAVTDEDTVEFVHSLQSESRRPRLLVDELRERKVIMLGTGYSGWLARFFLRVTKGDRILLARKADVLADARASGDAELGAFLKHFSTQTSVFEGGATAFIDELSERWEVASAERATSAPVAALQVRDEQILPHAIFISYASEDRERAAALASALVAAKLPVWFDRSDLQGGDRYEEMIRRGIEGASLFVPLLSPNVLTTQRRFFKLEWSIAADVARLNFGSPLPFVVPVRIGDVSPDAAGVPAHIRATHWMDASAGVSIEPVVDRLRALYREYPDGRQLRPHRRVRHGADARLDRRPRCDEPPDDRDGRQRRRAAGPRLHGTAVRRVRHRAPARRVRRDDGHDGREHDGLGLRRRDVHHGLRHPRSWRGHGPERRGDGGNRRSDGKSRPDAAAWQSRRRLEHCRHGDGGPDGRARRHSARRVRLLASRASRSAGPDARLNTRPPTRRRAYFLRMPARRCGS